jgi:hypothetical protein
MEVNNFERIKKYMQLIMVRDGTNPKDKYDAFFEIRILTRNKDFNEKGHTNDFCHSYHIYSIKDLENYQDQIIKLCNMFNARAYFGICRKSVRGVTKRLHVEIAKSFLNDDLIKPWKLIDRVTMSYYKSKERKFMIDIDSKDIEYINYISSIVNKLGGIILTEIPTVHGIHLITTPFNLDAYKELINKDNKEISEIKKNHITLLYANTND